jgi:DNA-binding MarR family transcriptional regulator
MYDLEFTDTAMTTWTMLRQTWTAVNKMAEVKLAKVGLTPEKAAVLWLCRDYSGTLTPAEIARYLFRENQTIAGLLNRMEAEGLVKRVPKRKGHPFTEVRLTPKGEEACGPGVEAYKKVVTSALVCQGQGHRREVVDSAPAGRPTDEETARAGYLLHVPSL